MSPKDPVYYDPDWKDPLPAAQRRYNLTKKGKAAQRKYYQSEKGRETIERHRRKCRLARECAKWLPNNPGKTVADFLAQRQEGQQ